MKDQAMSTRDRYERGYLLLLLRTANTILRELQHNIVVLPGVKGPRKSVLK
jgi:hypothetical protein